jgi:predicted nucleic acid-binding protein
MPTRVGCFLDTNILLYAALGKADEPRKFAISRELLAAWDFGISSQVLGEFFVNVQRKSQRPLRAAEAAAWIAELEDRPCAVIDRPLVGQAIDLSQRFKISYWDAAVVAAAERIGAAILYTEDLNDGQVFGPVTVRNPFLGA